MQSHDALHPLTQKLLQRRGICDIDDAFRFLFPDYARDTHDPFLMLNMDKAVARILDAIARDEHIVVYGDYDCDGIPGSVILHDFFQKVGYKNFSNYIPHRHLEGYGLHKEAIESFARINAALIITIDCGITDIEEIALAQDLGMDVIVTDHHVPPAQLPLAYTIVNPKQESDTYPFPMLCGAGIAFKLVQGLIARGNFAHMTSGWEKWLLDMAGLATIADMVPLTGENRVLAYFGLKVLRKSPRPGLHALLKEAKIDQSHLNEEDVGFTICPRINAASRMDIPFIAFELLATKNLAQAGERARYLAGLNVDRKAEVARMTKEAKKLLRGREIREVIVVGSPHWRVGVAGIVANQLAKEFDRPVFVWGKEEGAVIRGSCRSDGKVNMIELMVAAKEGVFLDKGGHEFSGGFSVAHDSVHFLEDELIRAFHLVEKKEVVKEPYAIDAELSLSDVNEETYHAIELLAPFGEGNPKPHFLFPRVLVREAGTFGAERNHLKLVLCDDGDVRVQAIGFFMSADDFPSADISDGGCIDLVATFEKSYFRGRAELRLRIIDIY